MFNCAPERIYGMVRSRVFSSCANSQHCLPRVTSGWLYFLSNCFKMFEFWLSG